jgi:hypothetical protein
LCHHSKEKKISEQIMRKIRKQTKLEVEIGNLFKRLILFAVEINEIESTAYESIGDGTNNNNNNNASSSPDNSDDFVLVPNNLPAVDAQAYDGK